MSITKKLLPSLFAGALLAMGAGSASANLLANAGFEDPDLSPGPADLNCAGTGCPGWTGFGDWGGPFIVDERTDATTPGGLPARTGDQKLKQFSPNTGVFQDFAVNPGDTAGGSVWFGKTSGIGDDMGDGFATVNIEWLDAGGVNLGLTSLGALYDPLAHAAGLWVQVGVAGTAPAGAATARFVIYSSNTIGAVFADDAEFNIAPSAIPVPAAVWLFGSGLVGLVGVARRRKG